ncbi:hypothetical protein [Haloglycomyces albus]|uniref:hypothetical protein n=1 Tax=Haloglycomyces albus TaxID=526067 RepID=UPI00046CDA91|nr:hypothetical protein [Haloglycomyces albus]
MANIEEVKSSVSSAKTDVESLPAASEALINASSMLTESINRTQDQMEEIMRQYQDIGDGERAEIVRSAMDQIDTARVTAQGLPAQMQEIIAGAMSTLTQQMDDASSTLNQIA